MLNLIANIQQQLITPATVHHTVQFFATPTLLPDLPSKKNSIIFTFIQQFLTNFLASKINTRTIQSLNKILVSTHPKLQIHYYILQYLQKITKSDARSSKYYGLCWFTQLLLLSPPPPFYITVPSNKNKNKILIVERGTTTTLKKNSLTIDLNPQTSQDLVTNINPVTTFRKQARKSNNKFTTSQRNLNMCEIQICKKLCEKSLQIIVYILSPSQVIETPKTISTELLEQTIKCQRAQMYKQQNKANK
eukprot:TRINITY_DN10258_c0_g1_i13.p1 TRINITY_DN10258_c0_g1~~TRINITY_DN10258_c0_g1_i13.p1  ORF type:complete len:265 (+),score=-2.81 TRINITY_DN10258_c0_g1_i13:53-796(+)